MASTQKACKPRAKKVERKMCKPARRQCPTPTTVVPEPQYNHSATHCSDSVFRVKPGVKRTTTVNFDETVATYSCQAHHHHVSGDMVRHCQSDGTWSGTEPLCEAAISSYLLSSIIVLTVTTISAIWLIIDFRIWRNNKVCNREEQKYCGMWPHVPYGRKCSIARPGNSLAVNKSEILRDAIRSDYFERAASVEFRRKQTVRQTIAPSSSLEEIYQALEQRRFSTSMTSKPPAPPPSNTPVIPSVRSALPSAVATVASLAASSIASRSVADSEDSGSSDAVSVVSMFSTKRSMFPTKNVMFSGKNSLFSGKGSLFSSIIPKPSLKRSDSTDSTTSLDSNN